MCERKSWRCKRSWWRIRKSATERRGARFLDLTEADFEENGGFIGNLWSVRIAIKSWFCCRQRTQDFMRIKKKSELKNAVNLWTDMFREEPAESVALAVNFLIANNTFPLSIARSQTKAKIGETQTWRLVRRALSKSVYSPKEKYAKLLPEIQRAVGSPMQLYKWAMLDAGEV